MEHRLAVKSKKTISVQFQYEREQAIRTSGPSTDQAKHRQKTTPTKKEPQGYGKVLSSWFKSFNLLSFSCKT